MSEEDPNYPRLGDTVYYFDENKQPFAAIVAHVYHNRTDSQTGRPVCNLAIFKRDGRIRAQVEVEPAYDDGEKWRLIEKWSWPDEVPEDQYDYMPAAKMRTRQVGKGETIVP